jgi:hypothetical protein
MHAIPPHVLPNSNRRPVKAAIDGFTDIALLLVPDKQLKAIDTGKLRKTEARIGDRIYPAYTPHLGTVTFDRDEEEHAKLHYEEQKLREHNVAYAKDVAQDYSRLTGITVHLHSPHAVRVEPLPAKSNEVHVIFGATPTGPHYAFHDIEKVFGQTLDNKAWYFRRTGPIKGRGVALHDPDDKGQKPLVQVVGRTAYMLTQALSITNRGAIDKVFRGMLNLVHQGLPLAAKRTSKRIVSASDFADRYKKLRAETHAWRKAKIIELELEVERNLTAYQKSIEDLRVWKTIERGEDGDDESTTKTFASRKEFKRIRSMPEVAGIEFKDEGLHILTKDLTAVFDGKSFKLGAYVVRISDHEFALFCEQSHHPKGFIHPHYPNTGVPCWGNAGIPIVRAYRDGRIADFIELVIKWLTQGYDPALADTKIEEWPHAT